MKDFNMVRELRSFLLLWSTQSLSALGSSMTSFALVIWVYQQTGSALSTALLTVCSYAPYVAMSIFAGALSDRWSKKITMLISDTFAAFSTAAVLVLLITGHLHMWHMYIINMLSGLMNTVQQPAADVSVSLLTPKKYYQKVSGLRSLSNSLISILSPVLATALLAFAGIRWVIILDLSTFLLAFITLFFFIEIPDTIQREKSKESILQSAKKGLSYLKQHRGILILILFLAAINFTASVYNTALPAMLLSKTGSESSLGFVNAAAGIAMLLGSIIASVGPAPKSRVRVICNTLLISMSTENFFLAFGRSVPIWCIGAVLGWVCIPIMNANLDVLFRNYIPVHLQGRVYAARNTLQFFTIPLGYLFGGILIDEIFEPLMSLQQPESLLTIFFGSGKGSGSALLFFVLGIIGILTCLIFRRSKSIWRLESENN